MSAIFKTFEKNTRGRLGEVREKEKDRDLERETVKMACIADFAISSSFSIHKLKQVKQLSNKTKLQNMSTQN